MPVCSDLNLLLIVGHGAVRSPPLPRRQKELREWCASHCASIVLYVDGDSIASSFRCLWGKNGCEARLPAKMLGRQLIWAQAIV